MSRLPHKFVFEPHEVGVYHCINRCCPPVHAVRLGSVHPTLLEHRKVWLR
jgi:hypothetical protein